MDAGWYLREAVRQIRENGFEGLRWTAEKPYHKLLQQQGRFSDSGEHVYDRDWDLLIVLDACRLDLMAEVAAEYDYVPAIREMRSVNSVTRLWMESNFNATFDDKIERTAYVSGNPWSADLLDGEAFSHLSHVWERVWAKPGTIPPEAITNETIRVARSGDYDYIVAHYMQPHCPFLSAPSLGPEKRLDSFGNQPEGDVWNALQRGDVTKSEVWKAYRENLRIVMDDLERLLQNVDAPRTVITSDHGNAVGEYGVYGHHPDMGLDCLRTVPWIETTAEDTGRIEPGAIEEHHDVSRDEQLKALGYM